MEKTRETTPHPGFTDATIMSRHNPKIKQLRALLKRPERERTGLAVIEGLRLVTEALVRFPDRVRQIIIAPDLLKSQQGQMLVHDKRSRGIPVVPVSAEVFESISQKDGPQGIAAVIAQRWECLEQVKLRAGELWVALAAIQDPGNLGTILRSCDATGCQGIILLDHSTDPYDPTALRASMGAIFSQRLVRTSFHTFTRWKDLHHYTLVGTSDAAPLHYREATYPSPTILLMGSERHGLSPEQQAVCDTIVSIPMRGICDSLNIAIATAVVLYEILDRRGLRTSSDNL
ncbi:MAG TPA: RNA methyltransferase [Ktedonobacteraceae bacterium]